MRTNRLPRLPLTVFEPLHTLEYQILARDQLEYVDLAADHRRHSYALKCDQHALNIARVEHRNSGLCDGLKHLPTYAIGG